LSVNSGAYITEIFRAGIQSIDRGQFEASRSLDELHIETNL
ncbi:ABC-type amino acid transport system, permease component, partial [Snodgrassella alvi SCGC AB-598-J21]